MEDLMLNDNQIIRIANEIIDINNSNAQISYLVETALEQSIMNIFEIIYSNDKKDATKIIHIQEDITNGLTSVSERTYCKITSISIDDDDTIWVQYKFKDEAKNEFCYSDIICCSDIILGCLNYLDVFSVYDAFVRCVKANIINIIPSTLQCLNAYRYYINDNWCKKYNDFKDIISLIIKRKKESYTNKEAFDEFVFNGDNDKQKIEKFLMGYAEPHDIKIIKTYLEN